MSGPAYQGYARYSFGWWFAIAEPIVVLISVGILIAKVL